MANKKSISHWRWMLRIMGWWYIPLIGFVRPRLVEINDESLIVRISLRRRTKNHLKSMYFGALAIGADVAAGMHVFYFCDALGVQPKFAFKAMNAQFLKRAQSEVRFICTEGQKVKGFVELAIKTGERQNGWVEVLVYDNSNEQVAVFQMEISVKIS